LLVLIDNYDSFVHNLSRYCNELDCETVVLRNDVISVAEVLSMRPEAVVISPGPCTPKEAGISEELISACVGQVPLLGVCLGHQAIASASGGNVIRADRPVHGMTSEITHDGSALFHGLPNPLQVMRYHSLIVDEQTLPGEYVVTARTNGGIPMAIAHTSEPIFGVQFHPEAVLTEQGHRLLANFLSIAGIKVAGPANRELRAKIDRSLWAQEFEQPAG
jgi:anthranilate synthase/aminodeoxychorismate synthase-like glutamine amidotransferase